MSSEQRECQTILIVGAGCFGLSTALALTKRESYNNSKIILLDMSHLSTRTAASLDLNRIVRSDYSNCLYASLAKEAHELWRHGEWGSQGRYSEAGLLMLADAQSEYLDQALALAEKSAHASKDEMSVFKVDSEAEIMAACKTGGCSGKWGYLNQKAGWVDASGSLGHIRELLNTSSRIDVVTGKVVQLLYSDNRSRITGVVLEDGSIIWASLTVLATGAWTPMLLNMAGRAAASAEVLTYIDLEPEQSARLRDMPSIINLSKGWFIMPPARNVLKVARHGQGFPSIPDMLSAEKEKEILTEGIRSCREALKELIPWLGDRNFDHTRLCWYTDTPTADFVLDFHPDIEGLFVATGGSGHAFKFLPVLGERIADALEGILDHEYRALWSWKPGATEALCRREQDDLHSSAYRSRGG